MKVYISGKMRGMPEEESRKKFKEAEEHLKESGFEVLNPWDAYDVLAKACAKWEDGIIFDLILLKGYDVIYMLDNWQDSYGARCEYEFAKGRDMKIIFQGNEQTEFSKVSGEKLVILDFTTNTIHIHPLERENFIDDSYIEDVGYDSSNCHWMAGDISVMVHEEVLR